jgi:hypothetical protein
MAMPLHPFELFSTREELCRQLVHLTDREGRPVCAEGFLSDEDFQRKIETRQCPYPGSRRNHPMNVSALRQVAAHWKEILGALVFLHDRSGSAPLSLWEMRRAAVAGVALPGYVLCQGGSLPVTGCLEPFFSGTSKILFDVITVADRQAEEALQRGELELLLESPVDVERLVRIAEDTGAFIGPRGACAAPEALVREALTTLTCSRPASRVFSETVEQVLGGRDGFFRFADAFLAMDIACCFYQFVVGDLAQSLVEALSELPREVLGSLGQQLLGALKVAIKTLPDLDFVSLPRERRRLMVELHAHYLRRLGLPAPAPTLLAADEPGGCPRASELSPQVKQLLEPALAAAVRWEQLAARDLLGLARAVSATLGWMPPEEPARKDPVERLLGIKVSRVLREACETPGTGETV